MGWFIKSSSKVILFLDGFLCTAAFFSCDSSVVKFELLENVCGIVFFLLFAQYVGFLNCDLAISKFTYLGITNFKKIKKHPYTESI